MIGEETTPREIAEFLAPIFQEHGWKYWNGAPDVERIEETVSRLKESIKRGAISAESGRILVRKPDEELGPDVYLLLGSL